MTLESSQEFLLVDIVVILFHLLFMSDRKKKATKVKCKQGCKRDESTTVQSISQEYILLEKKHWSFAGACLQ